MIDELIKMWHIERKHELSNVYHEITKEKNLVYLQIFMAECHTCCFVHKTFFPSYDKPLGKIPEIVPDQGYPRHQELRSIGKDRLQKHNDLHQIDPYRRTTGTLRTNALTTKVI